MSDSPPSPAHVALALYILTHAKRPESPLRAYIDSLPRSFENVPLTWDDQLTESLPSSAKDYLTKQQIVFKKHLSLAEKYMSEHAHLQESLGSPLDRSDFQWAWLVVNSRCIFQSLSSTSTRDDNYACAPLIDMINHVPSSTPHCKLSYDIKGLSVLSQSSYKCGQEVFISYGAHSNEALLCEYGFTIPGNSDNSLSLDRPLSKFLESWHVGMLMEMGYYEDWTIDHRGYPSFRTEVVLRAALLTKDECVEGTNQCRKLTQFVNGRSSGKEEQAGVDALLLKVLEQEESETEKVLSRPVRDGSADVRLRSIRQLFVDRLEIIQAALDHLTIDQNIVSRSRRY